MRLLPLAALLLCVSLLTGGCVSRSTFQAKVDEAAMLAETVKGLETEFLKLRQDHESLLTRNADLDQQLLQTIERNAGLQQDLQRARVDIERLEKVLFTRSAEAGAAMTEMRQTIDLLEEQNRELQQQVEQERIAREARLAQIKNTYDELVNKMEAEIERGEITISELQGRLTVNMVERILFDSGSAVVKPAGLEVLRRVGDILRQEREREIRVEGHTDNVPISPRLRQTFPSNWELSTARAANVVHFLQDQVGIPGERLAVSGYGEHRPVSDNATAEGRAQNRRIQIVLLPLERHRVEPLR